MERNMIKEIREQPDILRSLFNKNTDNIKRTINCLHRKSINHLLVAARGTSDHVGVFAKYLFEYYLGVPVCLAASSIINVYSRKLDLSSALTLAISQSGAGPDILGLVKEAKRQGSVCVGITNNESSPLALEVDFPLFCHAGPEKSVAATKTCTSSMMVVARLLYEWGQFAELKNNLTCVPQFIQEIIERSEEIRRLSATLGKMTDCAVLARGLNYCAALETALKIQETCYINARGYSAADFLHGPLAMLNPDFPAIVFAFKGPTLNGLKGVLKRIEEIGNNVILVTNDEALAQGYRSSFLISADIPEEAAPFISIVFGQLFAYHLAVEKGVNPDLPRRLQKVTQTF